MLAAFQAVHAKHTFTYTDLVRWLAGSLAIGVTELALAAFIPTFSYSPDRESTEHTKKGAQWTDEPAVKSGNLEVQEYRC
jgi:hypothetical protein